MCWPSFAKHLHILQFKTDLSCAERPSRQSWRSKHIQRSCAPIWAWWCLEKSDQIIWELHKIASVCHRFWMWVFPKIGVLQNGWFIRENPIKMDDLGVFPIFGNTQISGGVDLEEIGHWWFGSLWLFGPTSTRDYDVTWFCQKVTPGSETNKYVWWRVRSHPSQENVYVLPNVHNKAHLKNISRCFLVIFRC